MSPYRAAFRSRFQQMLQYRSAALAGFATQCWWGGIKVTILAAFYGAAAGAASAPMSLSQAITYTWIAQALLVLLPWMGDPEVALSVRSGAVAYDRLRPVDPYAFWFARTAGWLAARALPRAALMLGFAAVLLPSIGAQMWAWRLPVGAVAGVLFVVSVALALLLASAITMLMNVAAVMAMNERGINALLLPLVLVFSGNLLPLPLFPDALRTVLLVQPFAGLLDIPLRLYSGQLAGGNALFGLALQVFWITLLVVIGRAVLNRAFRDLQIQGG